MFLQKLRAVLPYLLSLVMVVTIFSGFGADSAEAHGNHAKKRDIIEYYAKKYVGVDYKLGADYNRDGSYKFDCSSFTQIVMSKAGIKIPRAAIPQYEATKDRRVPNSKVRRGDLLFFDLNRNGYIDHVGIYLGNGKFAHASTANGGKVQISKLSGFWKATHIKSTRVV